jgi:hypothetical protein
VTAPGLRAIPAHAALALALALAGCKPRPAPSAAPPPAPSIRDTGGVGARAFERMKELAGNWLAGELPVTFEVIERGHAIVQRGGFFVVWYPDGNTLAASAFTDEGYHVRMRSTKLADGPGGELDVELAAFEVANVVPDEPTARSLAMTIAPNNDGVTQRWSFGTNLDAPPRELVLTRTETGAPPPSTRKPPPRTPAEGTAPAEGPPPPDV